MTIDEFRASPEPPADAALAALWHDARAAWDKAHHCVQDDSSREGAWVHAYLHRKEGDASNARYWYSRASQPVFSGSLDEEWTHIASALLAAK